MTKVIRRDVLRGDLTDADASQLVDGLIEWPLNVVRVTPLLRDAWTMRNTITIHDGLYVALARHLGATFVTVVRCHWLLVVANGAAHPYCPLLSREVGRRRMC